MRRGRPSRGAIVAVATGAALLAGGGSAGASEYSESLARKIEREVVYVDPKAKPRVSVREAGQIRLRILDRALGRLKMAVVPESRAAQEGGTPALAHAINRDLPFKGALLVVAGQSAFAVTSYENAGAAVRAVQRAFARHEGDRPRQLLASVDELAKVDPGPSADLRAPSRSPGTPDFGSGDDIFDDINDAAKVTTLIIGVAVALPFVAIAIVILLRVRRGRREQEEDWDFAQEGLRNELIALGDDIRALDVDTSMPGVNALGLADYEAAVAQYERANTALDRAEENPRLFVAEARAALKEGRRRMSDAKVRFGVTPTP